MTRAGRDEPGGGSAQLSAVAREMAQSLATREVSAALRADGVRCILLKGAALARALGDDVHGRRSLDVDVLVDPADLTAACRTLARLGFKAHDVPAKDRPEPRWLHAQEWWREADLTTIDLHVTIPGIHAPVGRVWEELSRRTAKSGLPGVEAEVLDPGGLAFHVALHAAQHGRLYDKPIRDLARALDRFTPTVWQEAYAMAKRLDAEAAFGAGLRLLPEGRRIADELGVIDRPTVQDVLHGAAAPGGATALELLARRPGIRGKAALTARKLVPASGYMRLVYPIARRGRAGLLLAYLFRQVQVVVRLGPAVRAWRAARLSVGGGKRSGR